MADRTPVTDRTMTQADMVRTSNEWMRRYIEHPEQFMHEFQSVTGYMKDAAEGREPTYGERCTSYQFYLLDQMMHAEVPEPGLPLDPPR